MKYTREFVHGTHGEDVRAFQVNLMILGYDLPQYGADSWYGGETEGAARQCAHDQHRDHDWDACPVWYQVWVQEYADQAKPPIGWVPEGRGMFIQSMNTVSGAAEVQEVVEAVDLKFVVVQAHWQYSGQDSSRYNWPSSEWVGPAINKSYGCTDSAYEAITKFREMGVEVIPFSYPVPGKHQEVIDVLSAYAELWESPSVIIDPEAEWKDGHEADAEELAALMSGAFESWGMTSYGAPWYHRSFPFEEFNTATYGMPQTYGVSTFGTSENYNRALDEWSAYGYDSCVALYGTYSKTDSQMRQILSVVAGTLPFATAGWKWGTTSDVEWEHIHNILPD